MNHRICSGLRGGLFRPHEYQVRSNHGSGKLHLSHRYA